MADDRSDRGAQDRSRISLSEDYEVRYWTHELGVSKEKLTDLVRQHGDSAKKIRRALGE
jgi:hypothetical protein